MQLNTTQTVTTLLNNTYKFLTDKSRTIPRIQMQTPVILDDYFGDGYGYPTPEGQKALELFKTRENINLDPVYTAKTAAALLDFIKNPSYSNDPILYWHTYNSVVFSKEAASIDYHDLPSDFHRFFEDDGEKGPE